MEKAMSYFYKTESPKVLAAVRGWDENKAAWDAQRKKLGEAYGAAASPMYSGSRNYVGGIKLSASRDLDVHWCRPDEYGYTNLCCNELHTIPPESPLVKVNLARRRKRLEVLMSQAAAKMDFKRVEVLKNILFPPHAAPTSGRATAATPVTRTRPASTPAQS